MATLIGEVRPIGANSSALSSAAIEQVSAGATQQPSE
jgi:hypothetical protein